MHEMILVAFLSLALAVAATSASAATQLALAESGRSDYTIVVADSASPSTKHGASELQAFLKQMTGAELPIISDRQPVGPHEILVGDSAHLRQLGVEMDWKALGNEGYVLRTVGPHLVIAGGTLRGTMYGVYGLLEDHLGCRWFTPDVSRIPSYDKLVVGPLDETRLPALEYRDPYFIDCFDGDWNARNRSNGASARLDESRGGKVTYEGFSHTFFDFISPDEYFDQHPEYFSEINGKRVRDRTQLCCTNEDVIRLITEKLRQRMREHPEANVFSVTQMDWDNYCQCEKCSALIEQEGTPGAPVFAMINRTADALADEFPDKAIDTFAYQWSRKPPRNIRPRPNVIIRLCSIECCFSHPLATCDSKESADFRKDIADWAKLCDRLWVWDYVTCFTNYLLPFPNLRVLDDNIRFFVSNHVTGIFEEGNYQSLHGEFATLRSYMMAKFLWNPNYDPDLAMNEFLEGVYGPAAGPIREYIDLLHDKVGRENIHIHISEEPDAPYLTDDLLARADALWQQAEAAVADQPEVLNRVRLARLSVDYTILERTRRTATSPMRIENGRYHADLDPVFEARADRFFALGEANDLTLVSEWRAESLAAYKERTLGPKAGWEVIALSGADLRLDVAPALGGRLLGLQALPDGANVAYLPSPDERGYPNAGGYSEFWAVGGRGRGWGRRGRRTEFEAKTSQTADANTLLLTARLGDNAQLSRTTTVPAHGAYFEMASTIANTSAEQQPLRGRTSFDLALGPASDLVVTLPDGRALDVPAPAHDQDGLALDPAQLAAGITLARRSGGPGIRIIASGPDLKGGELRGDSAKPRLTLTLSVEGRLAAGEASTLRQRVALPPARQ
ncbi:MAG: DUF4838 domain-containing protein [Armatimonadota bacterium]